MNKPIVFMYSGQGSQYYHMGKEYYLFNEVFRRWIKKLDNIFLNITGESVIRHIYDDSREKSKTFNNILFTHPAIFMVEYALTQVLFEEGIYPDYVLGSSLGEFTSCAVAGVMGYEEILECIVYQARMLDSYCPEGGMIAIIDDYSTYEKTPILHENSEMACVNHQSHFVISGEIKGLAKIERYLEDKGIIFQRLPVSFAFHSSLIDPAALSCKNFFKSKTFKKPQISLISCLTGGNVNSFDTDYFWEVVREPINLVGAINYLSKDSNNFYVDLGPSGTQANIVKYNLNNRQEAQIFSLITPYGKNTNNLDMLCKNVYLQFYSTN